MISEVVNSVFLTYLATEYSSLGANNKNDSKSAASKACSLQRRRHRIALVAAFVVTINVLDRVTGMGSLLHSVVHRFLHLPKILLAAAVYVAALYYDCQWTLVRGDPKSHSVSLRFWSDFGPRVARAFVRILPIYPILAVLASFGFLLVITAFEWLHWSTEILDWPIYYGTLYGPFSYIYWTVKSQVIDEFRNTSILPTATSNPPRRLGSV